MFTTLHINMSSNVCNPFLSFSMKQDIIERSGVEYNENEYHDHRRLYLATADCFQQCVSQQMTAASCERYIDRVLGPDLSQHVVSNLLEVVISPPRPPSVKVNSYFMVNIPTNIEGQMKYEI
jgi:hypothetical protein